MSPSRPIQLAKLPRVFQDDIRKVDYKLLEQAFLKTVSKPSPKIKSLLKDICRISLRHNENPYVHLSAQIPDPDFRLKWYELFNPRSDFPPRLYFVIRESITNKHPNLNEGSKELRHFFEARNVGAPLSPNRTIAYYPRLDRIGEFSEQLIMVAQQSVAESALYAWSWLESAQWHSFMQPDEESLKGFRDALFANLNERGAIDLLDQLEDGSFLPEGRDLPTNEQETARARNDSINPIGSGESSIDKVRESADLVIALAAESNLPDPLSKPHESLANTEYIEINQHTSVNPIDCWIPRIDELTRKAVGLKKSFGHFSQSAKQLAAIQELASFGDSGDAAPLLSTLESERSLIQIQNCDILSLLGARCEDGVGNGCDLPQLLRQIKDNPNATPDELVGNVDKIQKKADALLVSVKSAREELKDMKIIEADLIALIGSSAQKPSQPEQNASPCRILQIAAEQKKHIAALRAKLSSELNNHKAILIAECDQLDTEYNLSTNIDCKDYLITKEDIRCRIASAENIKEVEACKALLEQLKTKCGARRHYNPRELALRLQNSPDAFSDFLDLCRTLIEQGAPETTFLLLHLRQHLHPFEEISEFTDQALSILLEAACEATSGELPLPAVLNTLCSDPWLISIGRNDIESSDLYERFVIVLLGAVLAGDTEKAAATLVNIGAAELTRQAFPEVLNRILQATVTRRSIQIILAYDLAVKNEQERNICESIAFENGKYRHIQCGNAVHFARFEAIQIFPALTELWCNISLDIQAGQYDAAHTRLNNIDVPDWYDELRQKHDKLIYDHPHYTEKIQTYIELFLSQIQKHVTYCENIWTSGKLVITEDEIQEGLQHWGGTQTDRGTLIALVMRSLREKAQAKSLLNAAALCNSVIMQCPRFITCLRAQQTLEPNLKLEQLILEDLTHDFQIEEAARILEADSAWEQLDILFRGTATVRNQDWAARHKHVVTEFAERRAEVLAAKDQSQIDIFDACIQGGRFPAALRILEHCGQQKASKRAHEMVAASSFVDEQIKSIGAIKELADDANMPEEWQEDVSSLAAKIERQLRVLRRSEESGDAIRATKLRLAKAVDALRFVIQQHTQVFDEVEHNLQLSQADKGLHSITANDQERALENCPDLIKNWTILASTDLPDESETKRVWTRFIKEFAKICNLYHDEQDERKRFVTVPSIQYPFVVHQTAFYKPQSEFLKRPLRLYLYRQDDIDHQALQRLDAELTGDNSATWLHIVFAPQGLDKVRRFFKYDKGFKNFLLIDESFLYQICLVEKHDVPVRQALHASVTDLANSSPFVAQGYCHQSNNIYVGRKDILQKLQNNPQAMIWGGRRIGKTSVLHAIESTLIKRNYSVAYVYVDIEDNGDPDLSIAQKIAATLKLQNVESITDFERKITALRNNGSRVAFLIDEVDEYIKKSRKVHGNNFPLATVLRQLVMDDSSKDTVLVYSGYHQLFYEVKLDKGKQRVGHPFINLAQDIPIRDLTHDDVDELVKTGFEEMLGISVDPQVPRLISNRASRHPAFVQQFCRCLLEQASKRRSPGARITITPEDVEAVYSADGSGEGGEQPFIFYVNETLGYNLSHLGRATMLAIAQLHPENQIPNEDDYFAIQKIKDELNGWCEIIGIQNPETEHFKQTIELLVMTNMLTQNPKEHDEYRITYPTYIDILRRLDKLGKAAIEFSIQQYDAKERIGGVLL